MRAAAAATCFAEEQSRTFAFTLRRLPEVAVRPQALVLASCERRESSQNRCPQIAHLVVGVGRPEGRAPHPKAVLGNLDGAAVEGDGSTEARIHDRFHGAHVGGHVGLSERAGGMQDVRVCSCRLQQLGVVLDGGEGRRNVVLQGGRGLIPQAQRQGSA
eukprot:197164-Hanusia_phi.AAC.1